MKKLCVLTGIVYSALGFAVWANAALTPIGPHSWDGDDKLLQSILDTLYGSGNLTRVDDSPYPGDQIWMNLTDGGTGGIAQAKYAAYSQVFGYIPGVTGGSFVPLFTVQGSGYAADLTITLSGNSVPGKDTMPLLRWGDDPVHPSGSPDPPLWSSLQSDNADGVDHMLTWKITGNAGHPDNVIGNYVIAWEDLDFRGLTDKDYNDLVVEIHGAAPVPEASTLILFGSGLSGLLFIARKKRLIRS